MKVSRSCLICLTIILLSACARTNAVDEAYVVGIEQWRTQRIERLKQARGWLSLTGLHSLNPGINTLGFADTSGIRLGESGPVTLAVIQVDSSGISFEPRDTMILDEKQKKAISMRIDPDASPLMHYQSLYWTFLERAGQYYLRVWDTLSPTRYALDEIPHFPVDPAWRIKTTFTPADSGTSILLDDVLGLKRPFPVPGTLRGEKDGVEFNIIALDGGPDELFLIIEDATTDIETYPAGRYLYVDRPGPDGLVEIDFNKAYNPPCAFTEFATCLLAPPENRLSIAVKAGEKMYGH